MRPISELGDIDMLFYYGQGDLQAETEHDLLLGLLQDKRSLYYNRQDGAGVREYENHPNGLLIEVGLRYDIMSWVARRNSMVGDGDDGTKDRRVATSQTVILLSRKGSSLDIQVLYISYIDLEQPRTINIPLGETR